MKKYDRLMNQLGYQFKNINLLIQALTHRSASLEHNERFEFLGDSLLNMMIACALYEKFPLENEGQLSRFRAQLVKGDTLAEIATHFKLGDYLLLGQGELKSGGYRRASILSDTLEAIIAAIFLDSDFYSCQKVIQQMFNQYIHLSYLQNDCRDAKTKLQEYLQSKKIALPEYTLINAEENDASETSFYVSCHVPSAKKKTFGTGPTRKKAEQDAAINMLKELSQ